MNDDLLGVILKRMGYLTDANLYWAFKYKQQHGGRFGEACTKLGYCTQEQVNEAVATQEKFREGDDAQALLDIFEAHIRQYGDSLAETGEKVDNMEKSK